MSACQTLAANSYSLVSSTVTTNNDETMIKCVQNCEAGEMFIPDHDFNGLANYDHSEFDPNTLKCRSDCPSTGGTVNPKYVITNNYFEKNSSANAFYD
jgi:hypothetical protein